MNDNDIASNREILERELSIKEITSRRKENPEHDENGVRRCLDCYIPVPIKRIKAVDAVRCVGCQEEQESNERNYA